MRLKWTYTNECDVCVSFVQRGNSGMLVCLLRFCLNMNVGWRICLFRVGRGYDKFICGKYSMELLSTPQFFGLTVTPFHSYSSLSTSTGYVHKSMTVSAVSSNTELLLSTPPLQRYGGGVRHPCLGTPADCTPPPTIQQASRPI